MSSHVTSFVFRSYQPHQAPVTAGVIGPGGSIYATASADCDLKVFQLGVETPIFDYQDLGKPQTVMEMSRDECFLAAGTESGAAKVWDLRTGQLLWQEAVHKSAVTSLCFDDSGQLLATGCIDGTVRVWDFRGSHKMHELNTAVVQPVQDMSGISSPSGAPGGRPRPKQVQTSAVSDPTVTAMAFTPNGHWLLIGGLTGRVLVWSLSREAVLQEILVSPQGGPGALSSSQENLVDRGMYSETKETIRHICIHPFERTGIVADASCVSFWDLETFEELARGPVRAGGYYSTLVMGTDNVAVSVREGGISNFSMSESGSGGQAGQGIKQTITAAAGPAALADGDECVYLTGAASGWAQAETDGFLSACLRTTRSIPQLVCLCAPRSSPGFVRLTIVTLKFTEPFASRYGFVPPRRVRSTEHATVGAPGGRRERDGDAPGGEGYEGCEEYGAGADGAPRSSQPTQPEQRPRHQPQRPQRPREADRRSSDDRQGSRGPARPANRPARPESAGNARGAEGASGAPAGDLDRYRNSCAPDPARFDPSRVDPRLLADPVKKKIVLGSEEWADLLSARLAAARQFSKLWASGSFRQAVEALLVADDARLTCDVMLKADLRSGAGMDDLCPLIGPLTDCVLAETAHPDKILKLPQYAEQLISDCAKIVVFLGELFYRTVADTFTAFGRAAGAPDIALEERHARCMSLYRSVCAFRRAMIDFEPRVITSKMKGVAVDAISKLGSMGFRDERK